MDLLWIVNYVLLVAIFCECVDGQRREWRQHHRQPPKQCELPNGDSGICIPIDNCRKALAQIRRNITPTVCHFRGRYPFVCCKRRRHVPEAVAGSKSNEKCEEYKNIMTEEQQFFVPTVVGGENSLAKEFPHMAALGYGSEDDIQWNCGGSLISDQFVLTAGHCLYPQALGEVQYVRLGDLNLATTSDNAETQDFKVIQRIPHPDYSPPSQYNDIGLIQLDGPVKYTAYVKPACLQTGNDLNDTLAIATGWGLTEFGGATSDHLQKVYLRYFTNEQCQKTYEADSRLQRSIVDDLQLCAGGIDEEKDTCQGDSGGPLQFKTTLGVPAYYIIGVTSFGKGCGVANTPGVYTRVSNYVPWIEQIVWPN